MTPMPHSSEHARALVALARLAGPGGVTFRSVEPWRRDLAARIDPALRYRVLGVQQRGDGIIEKLLSGQWEEYRERLEQDLGRLPVQRDPADNALYFSRVALSCGVDHAGAEDEAHHPAIAHEPDSLGKKLKRIVGHLLLRVLAPLAKVAASWVGQTGESGR